MWTHNINTCHTNKTCKLQIYRKHLTTPLFWNLSEKPNMLRVWIGGWRHVEHLDPTKAHTGILAMSWNMCVFCSEFVLLSRYALSLAKSVAWRLVTLKFETHQSTDGLSFKSVQNQRDLCLLCTMCTSLSILPWNGLIQQSFPFIGVFVQNSWQSRILLCCIVHCNAWSSRQGIKQLRDTEIREAGWPVCLWEYSLSTHSLLLLLIKTRGAICVLWSTSG